MFKKISVSLVVLMIFTLLFTASSCKKNNSDGKSELSKNNSDLLIKNGDEVSVKMIYKPNINDKFRYKMNAKTINNNKDLRQKQELTEEQDMTYYYTQEVVEVSSTGYITFKMTYDSIIITEKKSNADTSVSRTYNSEIQDSVSKNPEFIQYNALKGSAFKFRVSPKGEVMDVFELETIHEKLFKSLGDTLKKEEKEEIKKMMGAEALKSLIQNQFQKFPEQNIKKDSTWSYSDETNLSLFPVKNNMSYKLSNINSEKNLLIDVDATLGIDFISKTEKQENTTVKLSNEKAGGSGKVSIDLSKGCVVKKNTQTTINMNFDVSAKGQSASFSQELKTFVSIELL